MKKIICIALALATFSFALCSCSSTAQKHEQWHQQQVKKRHARSSKTLGR